MKKLTTIILSTACAFAVGSAFADLTIVNNSDSDSTMKINGICTAKLGPIIGIPGVTPKHGGKNSYTLSEVKLVCGASATSCDALLYSGQNCDTEIGKGTISISSSDVTLSPGKLVSESPDYKLTGEGTSTLTISNS